MFWAFVIEFGHLIAPGNQGLSKGAVLWLIFRLYERDVWYCKLLSLWHQLVANLVSDGPHSPIEIQITW